MIDIFSSRTFTYYNTGVRESIENVTGYVYELPPTTFANESINPHNWCYENNLPSGVHNSSNCKGMCVFTNFFFILSNI